jgi:hypothetical protein
MRVTLVLLLLFVSGTCFADDPLESLNTVEDTVSTMQSTLKAKAAAESPEAAETDIRYFISAGSIGASDYVAANPCPEGVTPKGNDTGICLPQGGSDAGARLWKSRNASAEDLRAGTLVLARDEARDDAWVMAKVTDLSEVASGYVGISAPFKAQLKGLRVVME